MRRNSKETKLQLPNRSFNYKAWLKFHPRHIFDTRKKKQVMTKKNSHEKKLCMTRFLWISTYLGSYLYFTLQKMKQSHQPLLKVSYLSI